MKRVCPRYSPTLFAQNANKDGAPAAVELTYLPSFYTFPLLPCPFGQYLWYLRLSS
jgi:hypothetical protein